MAKLLLNRMNRSPPKDLFVIPGSSSRNPLSGAETFEPAEPVTFTPRKGVQRSGFYCGVRGGGFSRKLRLAKCGGGERRRGAGPAAPKVISRILSSRRGCALAAAGGRPAAGELRFRQLERLRPRGPRGGRQRSTPAGVA